jgi:integral membrane sensor domain MASE1
MHRRWPIRLAQLALLTGIYVAAGKLGLSMAILHPSASPVWPPTGIAIAAVIILGSAAWPAIAVGAFIVNITTAGTVWTSLGIATGNTLEAILGAFLVERFANGRHAFDRTLDLLRFALLAGFLATLVSATIGVTSFLGLNIRTALEAAGATCAFVPHGLGCAHRRF